MMKPNILCVDDEPVNLMLFKANFKDKFNIFTALNGGEGLDILSNNKDIHMIFSDMKMPKMNGIEFIGNARDILPHGYFYIMTGYEVTDEIQAAIDKKFIRKYFKKPLNFNTIASEIERVIKQKNR